ARRWRTDVPGSDPHRAVDLLRPVAPLRLAAVYAMFLAAIEPGEHPYHVHDVPAALARAAATP
ncbi:aminoglycoside phosphotransferase family protein, partial [Micromonospora chalcea]